MTIPDGQIWMLHHTGTAYYWTRWLDAPLRDDRVTVMGLPCRVVAVVDDACGESKVFVECVMVKKVDANQSEIVKALRGIGATVQILSDVGGGCPDLLVGRQGKNYLIEIKDGAKVKSARKLTPHQVDWHGEWRGQVSVVESVDDALAVVGVVV